MINALAVGHVTLDTYPQGLKIGGSVFYAARAWRALGARPQVITTAGAHFPRLLDSGWTLHPSGITTRFANRYDALGGRQQHLVAQAEGLVAPAVPPAADLAFLCPVLQDFAPEPWIAALAGTPIIAGGLQGWLKHAALDGTVLHGPRCDPRVFRGLHVAFLSAEDLAGRLDWLDALCSVVPVVYLTQGRQGALLFKQDCTTRIGTCPAREVDPTGAGDTFAAATLLALARGAGPVAAGRMGAAAASITVEHLAAAPLTALHQAPRRLAQVA